MTHGTVWLHLWRFSRLLLILTKTIYRLDLKKVSESETFFFVHFFDSLDDKISTVMITNCNRCETRVVDWRMTCINLVILLSTARLLTMSLLIAEEGKTSCARVLLSRDCMWNYNRVYSTIKKRIDKKCRSPTVTCVLTTRRFYSFIFFLFRASGFASSIHIALSSIGIYWALM